MRNIEKEMQKFNVSIYDIKELLDCTEKTVRNKLNGTTDFTFSEVKKIRDNLFPGMEIDYLFNFNNDVPSRAGEKNRPPKESGKGGKKMKKRNKVIIQILEIAVPILVSIPTTIITVLWLKGQL